MHIAIAGNIGAGKTTLTQKLSKDLNIKPIFESVDDNPYLELFYSNMSRWSFNLQIFFLILYLFDSNIIFSSEIAKSPI